MISKNESDSDEAAIYEFGEYRLEAKELLLFRNSEIVSLAPKSIEVLFALVQASGKVLTKQEILERVWANTFVEEANLTHHVSALRKALGDRSDRQKFIGTIPRKGYRFLAPVKKNVATELTAGGQTRTVIVEETEIAADFQNSPATGETASSPEPAQLEKINPPSGKKSFEERFGNEIDADLNQFVGRGKEMELLQNELLRVFRGDGQPLLIVGDPGIGKTQLSARFEHWARTTQKVVCLRARFYDYEAARISAGDMFLDLLKEAVSNLNPAAQNAARETFDLSAFAARLGIELPDEIFSVGNKFFQTQTDAYQIIAPLAECFLAISRRRPLVFIFDDLQWTDDFSRKIIAYLMRAAGAPNKLMVLALARREDCEDSPGEFAVWLNAQAGFRSFSVCSLRPLSEDDYKELLNRVFAEKLDLTVIPPDELALIYRTTEGNPYFLIETLRLLLTENVIEKTPASSNGNADAGWQWRGLRDVPLPETIRMAARSKLNRLTRETQDYVERAAVLGDAFQVETLHEMFAGEAEVGAGALENCLDEAIGARVLTEQNVSGADDCQFYHTTLRRAVYADLSPRRRRRLHLRAARAIEKIHRETERVAAALSVHYEVAGETELCFERALAAAEFAGKRFDWKEAAECAARADQAAEALSETATALSDENKLRLFLIAGEAVMSTGRRDDAEKTFEKAAALAAALNDEVSLAAARALRGHALVLLGRYREALLVSSAALDLAKKLNDHHCAAAALLQIGSAQYALGEFNSACQTLEEVIGEKHSDNYSKAVALGKIGWVRALQGRYEEGKILLERALAFHQTAGDVRQRIVLFLCLNWCEHGLGNYESAINYAAEAGGEARRSLGETFSEAVAAVRVAKARLAQGLSREAEAILNDALAKIKNAGSVHCQAEIFWFLGQAKIKLKESSAAEKLLDRALLMIREIGDREDEFRILIDVAELRILQNDFAEALETADQAVSIARELDIAEGIGAALAAKANALLKLQKFSEAREAIERALELLEAANSGEKWRAYFALAEILRADDENEKLQSINQSKGGTEHEQADNSQALETALRRTVELLSEIYRQFEASDAERQQLFLKAHQKPARRLHELLENSNQKHAAAELARFWHFS